MGNWSQKNLIGAGDISGYLPEAHTPPSVNTELDRIGQENSKYI